MMKLLILSAALLLTVAAAEKIQWRDCGDDNDLVKLSRFDVVPYPPVIKKGWQFTLFVKAVVKSNFNDATMALKIYRKVLGVWVKIPCVIGYGSCEYDNGCQLMDTLLREASIPEIPETCPGIKKQNVDMGNFITLPDIPSGLGFLAAGEYKVRGEVIETAASKRRVMCMEIEGRAES